MMIVYIISIASLFYLLWALIHHKKDKSLTLITTLEYLLTAALVMILLTGVIF